MISLTASFCPLAPMVRLSWVKSGLARYCIVPDRAATDVPDTCTGSVEANERTCLACFAARASASPGETGCSGWADWPPSAEPQPAARVIARQPTVLAVSRRRDDEEERIRSCLLNRQNRVRAGSAGVAVVVWARMATYASPAGGTGTTQTALWARSRIARHAPVPAAAPAPPAGTVGSSGATHGEGPRQWTPEGSACD